MSQIPPVQQEDFFRKLQRWNEMSLALRDLKIAEIILRKEIFGEAFPEPSEGTLYLPLGNGWRLKGGYSLSRSVDTTHLSIMREEMAKLGVSIDPLLNWKVDLRVGPYKALEEDARKLFDNIVTTKPDSPKLELVAPNDAEEEPKPESTLAAPEQVETPEVTIEVQQPKKKPSRSRKKKSETSE